MGNKPWRTLSVFLALGAFTVGCTNGPQKTTGLGANNQPVNKNGQLASQQTQQFPLANGQQQPPFNKQPLPQINPPGNQFNQTTGNPTSNQPNPFAPTSGLGNRSEPLEQFPPIQPIQKTGSQPFPQGGGMTPIGSGLNNPSNPVAPNTGSRFGEGQLQPINLNQPR